jgi:hypothetical protein
MNVKTLTPVDHNDQRFPEGTVLDLEEKEAKALILCGAAQELDKDSQEVGIKVPKPPSYQPEPMSEEDEELRFYLASMRRRNGLNAI